MLLSQKERKTKVAGRNFGGDGEACAIDSDDGFMGVNLSLNASCCIHRVSAVFVCQS